MTSSGNYDRIRSRASTPFAVKQTSYNFPVSCANRTTATVVYTTNAWFGSSEVTHDNLTVGYFKKRAQGSILPMNPFVNVKRKSVPYGHTSFRVTYLAQACSGPPITWWFEHTGAYLARAVWNSMPPQVAQIPGSQYQGLISEVTTKAAAERARGKANLVESLAELDRAFRMIVNPLENVRDLVRRTRRGGQRAPGFARVRADSSAFIQFTSAEWLRFRYGITPIVNDVKAALKALEQQWDQEPKRHSATSGGQAQVAGTTAGTFTGAGGIYRVNYEVTGVQTLDVRCTFVDMYKRNAFNYLGLTFENVVGLAWELTRYSFVVDWFVNVGDVIYANIPRVGVSEVTSFVSLKEYNVTTLKPTGLINLDPSNISISGSVSDGATHESTVTQRFKPSSSTPLQFKSDFRLDWWMRATDAAAITNQLLRTIGFNRR